MAKYQLKIMINTSNPSNVGFTELTSDMLLYDPPKGNKKNLVKYPFFDPDAIYPRTIIQNLEYSKRIEIFFNKEKFESVVLEYSYSMHKTKEKTEGIKHELASSNLEFTLQTLLSSGFGGYNFSTSLDFYDPDFTGKLLSMKGSNSEIFPFMSTRFNRTFSYLKIGGSVHTIIGLIWINDAFNHPLYSSVVRSYKTYSEDKNPELILKNISEIKMKLERIISIFCFDMVTNAPSFLNRRSNRYNYENENTLKNIQVDFETIVADIKTKLVGDITDFSMNIMKPFVENEVKQVISDYNIRKRYENEPDEKKATWFFKKLLENEIELLPNSQLKETKEKFIAKTKELNERIRLFLKKYKPTHLELFGNSLLKTDFTSFYRKARAFEYELRANEYLLTNEDYSHDTEGKEIESYITKTYNRSQNFTNSLKKLTEGRIFGNQEWERETKKYIKNDDNAKLRKSDESKNMFEQLLLCEDEFTLQCRQSPNFLTYLNTGLDQIIVKNSNPTLQTYNLFEAYVQINVAKGKITTLNYSGIKCSYLNNSLGYMYKSSGELTKQNYLVKKKVYFDFESELELINKTQKESVKPTNNVKTQKKSMQKKRVSKKNKKTRRRRAP